jgi:hypothetical protein
MRRENKGSSFDGWLREEGIYDKVSTGAVKRVLARRIEHAAKEKPVTKTDTALKGVRQ